MKNVFQIILIVIAGSFFSCNKVEDLLSFNINTSVNIAIPATTAITAPIALPLPAVSNSSSADLESNTNADRVRNVRLNGMVLVIESPDNETFSFLDEIEVFIEADGLPEILLASRTEIPDNIGAELELNTTGENLDDYIRSDEYRLRTDVVVDESIPERVDVRADLVLRVTADL